MPTPAELLARPGADGKSRCASTLSTGARSSSCRNAPFAGPRIGRSGTRRAYRLPTKRSPSSPSGSATTNKGNTIAVVSDGTLFTGGASELLASDDFGGLVIADTVPLAEAIPQLARDRLKCSTPRRSSPMRSAGRAATGNGLRRASFKSRKGLECRARGCARSPPSPLLPRQGR